MTVAGWLWPRIETHGRSSFKVTAEGRSLNEGYDVFRLQHCNQPTGLGRGMVGRERESLDGGCTVTTKHYRETITVRVPAIILNKRGTVLKGWRDGSQLLRIKSRAWQSMQFHTVWTGRGEECSAFHEVTFLIDSRLMSRDPGGPALARDTSYLSGVNCPTLTHFLFNLIFFIVALETENNAFSLQFPVH